MSDCRWTERDIGIALQKFFQKKVLIVDNCFWTGHECDLLIVEPGMRLIDVEIKRTRADFRADAGKEKWRMVSGWGAARVVTARQWPQRIWKHYYALPETIWSEDLLADLASDKSGILLLGHDRYGPSLSCHRRAGVNRDALPITPRQCVDLARLVSLRMWDAYGIVARRRETAQPGREEER